MASIAGDDRRGATSVSYQAWYKRSSNDDDDMQLDDIGGCVISQAS
jgi:hypothetical protein